MKLYLENIIGTISLFGIIISMIMLVGIAGAIDCDTITLTDGTKKIIIYLIILICSVIGILHVEREEDICDRM